MLLDISKLSRLSKNQWVFKYKNENFEDIVRLLLSKMEYDYIELTIWTFQVDLFKEIDHEVMAGNSSFSMLKLSKESSIKFSNPNILDEEIRFFEMNIYCNNEIFFKLTSDNYGEYTTINMGKTIDKEGLLEILNNVFV